MLILTMGLASSIQLTATSWLLNRVVEWGILVLVILFSRRSRRALERMGSGKLASCGFSIALASDLESAYPPDGGGLYRPIPGQGGRPDGVLSEGSAG